MSSDQQSSSLGDRLTESVPTIEKLRELCGALSTSVGVLHEGRVVMAESVGQRDAETELPADQESVYILGSLSKAFVAAAIGVLVDEGKMDWTDLVSKHVPNFDPVGDPNIRKQGTFVDLLRHSSGLANPVVQWLGPYGTIIGEEESLMDLVNLTPTANSEGQCFNRVWQYSNINYGIAARAVENVSGERFADFIKQRILEPLGMNQTAVFESDIASCKNLADGHARLHNGKFVKAPLEWTSENHTSILATCAMRSSIHDMLIWCAAWLYADDAEGEVPEALRAARRNPLRQVSRIFEPAWPRPVDDSFQNECAYCFAWQRSVMPSSSLNWGSTNSRTRFDKEKTYLQYTLGCASPKRVVFKHPGIAQNSVCNIFLFPETKSAVVALSNGRRFGDPSDFASQTLIQELFDLQPRVDILERAKIETKRGKTYRHETMMRSWLDYRDVSAPEKDLTDFVGTYAGFATKLHVELDATGRRLELVFNGRRDNPILLEYYNVDMYSFLPLTAEEEYRGSWCDFDYFMIGLLDFHRDDEGRVDGLYWQWDAAWDATWYQQMTATGGK